MSFVRVNTFADRSSACTPVWRLSALLLALLLGVIAVASPAHAQSKRADNVFYGRFGGGISDYTGDLPFQTSTHFADFKEFREGSGDLGRRSVGG